MLDGNHEDGTCLNGDASSCVTSDCSNEKPCSWFRCRVAAALGQDLETEPWAQGLVWDCTFTESECCVVADFHAPIVSHLNLTYLHSRLRHYTPTRPWSPT